MRFSISNFVLASVTTWTFTVYGQRSLVDPSFQVGSGADHWVGPVVVQQDGKIIVGGGFSRLADHDCSYLGRLMGDGQFDSSFGSGTDGSVSILLEQPDGNVLVAGDFTQLLGVPRPRIGRLLSTGVVDTNFDAGTLLNNGLESLTLAIQSDGKILVGALEIPYSSGGITSRVFRLLPDGSVDDGFIQTNLFQDFFVYAIYPRTDGSILVGGGFSSVNDFSMPGLALLDSGGLLDTNFHSGLEDLSTIFALVERKDGTLLAGGLLTREGSTNAEVLGVLTADFQWDPGFSTDRFERTPQYWSFVRSVVLQPDGKMVLTGEFYEVGGYWRRNLVRLDQDGRVDPCFDPGLGLGEPDDFGVTDIALQSDGRVLATGSFSSADGAAAANIVRLLPQSDCNISRIHFIPLDRGEYQVAATFPTGGTNYIQSSSNLVDWVTVASDMVPYVKLPYWDTYRLSDVPQVYFRALQQR